MKKQKKKSAVDRFLALSPQQRDAAVAGFDREFAADAFGPPPAHAKARLRLAQRKRGRPQVGKGAERVTITIERSLLAQTDAAAKSLKISRSELIANGLHRVLPRRRSA